MNYHQYYPIDVVNGPGTRCTLFVSGCIHKCKGCYNATTWKPTSGKLFDETAENCIISDLQNTQIKRQGLSLSGGDPLYPGNLSAILQLVKRVKNECVGKDIWLWTGYSINDLTHEQQQIVDLVNVVVDGKFMQELKDVNLIWRGSSNQIIHYLR